MKPPRLDRNEALPLMEGFFNLIERNYTPDFPHSAEYDKYLHQEFYMKSNNEVVCTDLPAFLVRLNRSKGEISSQKYTDWLEDPILGGNKIVLRYNVATLDKSNKAKNELVIAIVTIVDNKILQWSEVKHLEA